MKKVKKISKYVLNFLNMINLLMLGLAEVWGWNVGKISATIVVIAGVISAYLVSGKLFSTDVSVQSKFNEDSFKNMLEEGEVEHVSNKK